MRAAKRGGGLSAGRRSSSSQCRCLLGRSGSGYHETGWGPHPRRQNGRKRGVKPCRFLFVTTTRILLCWCFGWILLLSGNSRGPTGPLVGPTPQRFYGYGSQGEVRTRSRRQRRRWSLLSWLLQEFCHDALGQGRSGRVHGGTMTNFKARLSRG